LLVCVCVGGVAQKASNYTKRGRAKLGLWAGEKKIDELKVRVKGEGEELERGRDVACIEVGGEVCGNMSKKKLWGKGGS